MGPPSYVWYIGDRNVVMRRIPVLEVVSMSASFCKRSEISVNSSLSGYHLTEPIACCSRKCAPHIDHMSYFVLYVCCYWEPRHVLSIQMWTSLEWMWTSRGRNDIKTSLLVDSRIVLYYFIMDPLLPLPTLRMQNVRYTRLCRSGSTTGFCPFSLFFLPPPPSPAPTHFCCKHTLYNSNPVACLTGAVHLWASFRHLAVVLIWATAWFKPCRFWRVWKVTCLHASKDANRPDWGALLCTQMPG